MKNSMLKKLLSLLLCLAMFLSLGVSSFAEAPEEGQDEEPVEPVEADVPDEPADEPEEDVFEEPEEEPETEPADRPVTFKAPVEERKGGDKLSAYLAFVPIDVKELSNTRFESYIVNDCNYYLRYVYMTAEGTSWQVRSQGEVEPNTKLFIEEFGRDQLNQLERSSIQLIAYKRDKYFLRKPAVDALVNIDPVKFYKLHTFCENQFFEQPALIYTIIENDRQFVKL